MTLFSKCECQILSFKFIYHAIHFKVKILSVDEQSLIRILFYKISIKFQ